MLKTIKESKSGNSSFKRSYSSLSHRAFASLPPKPVDDDETVEDKEGEMYDGLSIYDQAAKPVSCDYHPEEPPIEVPKDYPRGAEFGTAIHEVFEKTSFAELGSSSFEDALRKTVSSCFSSQRIPTTGHDDWIDASVELVKSVLSARIPEIRGAEGTGSYFRLCELPDESLKREAEFNFNVFGQKLQNYCNGFIDLLFKRGEYYSIADWKSDRLNDRFTSFSDAGQLKGHVDEHYSIQRVLYSYCLIKWLKPYYHGQSEEQIFREHFGGVYYVFIRGCAKDTGNGIYCQTWNSWEDLQKAFNQIMHPAEK